MQRHKQKCRRSVAVRIVKNATASRADGHFSLYSQRQVQGLRIHIMAMGLHFRPLLQVLNAIAVLTDASGDDVALQYGGQKVWILTGALILLL